MKFRIKFANQIVGLVIILALASVAFVIVMLGQAQRWFANDEDFKTVLSTTDGLSKNMDVQFKGFTIGKVKNIKPNINKEKNEVEVEVTFTIHEDYTDLVREYSIVELQVGIISLLGSKFLFHPGPVTGKKLEKEGSTIPTIPALGSDEAKRYIQSRIIPEPEPDPLSGIVNQINVLLTDLNRELKPGETHTTDIGKLIVDIPQMLDNLIYGVIEKLMGDIQPLLDEAEGILAELNKPDGILAELNKPDGIITEVENLITKLNEPGGIMTMLDSDGELKKTIDTLPGLLENLTNTTAPLPSQLPIILMQLRTVLRTADDALTGLKNLPFVRDGVPESPVTQTTGPRNIQFFND